MCVFLSISFKSHIYSWHLFKYIYLCQNTEFYIMNKEKIPQRLYNLLEDAYGTFYLIVFLEVSKSYGIIPNGLKIKVAACI